MTALLSLYASEPGPFRRKHFGGTLRPVDMRRVLLLLPLVALLFAAGCVEKKYEEGRTNQEKKANDMMKNAEGE